MMPTALFQASSVLCFALPIAVVLYYRLYRHASLIALVLYYALAILRCIGSDRMPPLPDFSSKWEVLYNYIEVPLMLIALLFFCPARYKQKRFHFLVSLFGGYELGVAFLFGFTPSASLYIMVPGLLVIVAYSLYLFLRQLRFTIMHKKNLGRVLMLGAMLASSGCYLAMFCSYFIQEKPNVSGIYALYFLSSTIASAILSIGLYLMRQRIKGLQELKITRSELQMIFGG